MTSRPCWSCHKTPSTNSLRAVKALSSSCLATAISASAASRRRAAVIMSSVLSLTTSNVTSTITVLGLLTIVPFLWTRRMAHGIVCLFPDCNLYYINIKKRNPAPPKECRNRRLRLSREAWTRTPSPTPCRCGREPACAGRWRPHSRGSTRQRPPRGESTSLRWPSGAGPGLPWNASSWLSSSDVRSAELPTTTNLYNIRYTVVG